MRAFRFGGEGSGVPYTATSNTTSLPSLAKSVGAAYPLHRRDPLLSLSGWPGRPGLVGLAGWPGWLGWLAWLLGYLVA